MTTPGPWRKRPRSRTERDREATALTLLGPAAVRLLDVDGDELVLERIRPATPVSTLTDDDATRALAQALLRLWVPAPGTARLPDVHDECAALDDPRVTKALPPQVLAAARHTLADLLATTHDGVVLHGDLHHGNLLWSDDRREWVAVDPHGVVGDPAYDVGPLLINPWDRDAASLARRRLDLLADLLDLPTERLAAWGLVRAVLSEAWFVQDRGRPDGHPLAVAEALLAMTA